ncbi:putative exported protein [Vibrio maritimus]|uniref:Putative exported protein n=1 Tax=Vibrio maritimus TaxID=990268 RepID=A0A090RNR6_9VIBR|nr:putative exported protein [Vibrio maritimus]
MPYEPGVDLFWSITRYSGLTYNTIPGAEHQVYNAYNTVPDENGNITITFSSENPNDGTYWMPVNKDEPYYFVERYYGPRMAELETILQRCG